MMGEARKIKPLSPPKKTPASKTLRPLVIGVPELFWDDEIDIWLFRQKNTSRRQTTLVILTLLIILQ